MMTAAGAPKSTESVPVAEIDAAPSAPDLDERVAAALTRPARSVEVVALVKEAKAAEAEAEARTGAARERALDPRLVAAAVQEARKQMEDGKFSAARLRVAVELLGERQKQLEADEEDARRRERYEQLERERNRLASELRDLYPPFALAFADLMLRVEACDHELAVISRALPRGRGPLLGAELVARGLLGYVNNSVTTPRLSETVVLPEWAGGGRYSWPPSRRMV
jgi:hypothetical protein